MVASSEVQPVESHRTVLVELDGPVPAPQGLTNDARSRWIDTEIGELKSAFLRRIESLRVLDEALEVFDASPLFPLLVVISTEPVIAVIERLPGVKQVHPDQEVELGG